MIRAEPVTNIRVAFLERHMLRNKVLVHAIRLDDHVRDVVHDREVGLRRENHPIVGEIKAAMLERGQHRHVANLPVERFDILVKLIKRVMRNKRLEVREWHSVNRQCQLSGAPPASRLFSSPDLSCESLNPAEAKCLLDVFKIRLTRMRHDSRDMCFGN